MLRALLLCVLLLLVGAPGFAQTTEAEATQAVGSRGELIFALDRAGWVTTDDLVKRLGGRTNVPIKGWVVEREEGDPATYLVTYYGDGPSGPVAWYSGRVRDHQVIDGKLHPEGARPPLTPVQLRLKEAADVARKFDKYRPCTQARFNLVLIPPASADAPIDAYLLSPQVETDVIPVGGHYLLKVAGGKIVSDRAFMKTCMNADLKAAGSEAAGFFVTHLLDPMPTEIHVFTSLSMGNPIFVMAGDRLWGVDGAKITAVKQ